jgi:hypothetical protein
MPQIPNTFALHMGQATNSFRRSSRKGWTIPNSQLDSAISKFSGSRFDRCFDPWIPRHRKTESTIVSSDRVGALLVMHMFLRFARQEATAAAHAAVPKAGRAKVFGQITTSESQVPHLRRFAARIGANPGHSRNCGIVRIIRNNCHFTFPAILTVVVTTPPALTRRVDTRRRALDSPEAFLRICWSH